MSDMHIGARLERERLDRGMSQDEAAEMLGVSQATFSRWAQGSRPRSPYWTAIARFLKTPRAEVAQVINDDRQADPAEDRMRHLEDRFDQLEAKVDEVLGALGLAAAPKRRRAR